jgi:hypothetical protein
MSPEATEHPLIQPTQPALLGLFEKRVEGDDSLLGLAQFRFQQAGLGAEIHAGSPELVEHLLQFRPSARTPVVVHLPRDFDLIDETCRQRIVQLARQFGGCVRGFVVHDAPALTGQPAEYLRAAIELESRLAGISEAPMVFVEYAMGMEPGEFANFFKSAHGLRHVSACIDTGHVGIWQARKAHARKRPGEDVCALKSNPAMLPGLMPAITAAVGTALPVVLELIRVIAGLGKPMHLHLHDGHPLSTASPFGVSDHLSFLAEVPLAFEFQGRRSAPLLFGPTGLGRIARTALTSAGAERVSFTLEIHPVFEHRALGDAAPLFNHWTDKTNAEQMNHWLSVLVQNHQVLVDQLRTDDRRAASTGAGGARG